MREMKREEMHWSNIASGFFFPDDKEICTLFLYVGNSEIYFCLASQFSHS